MAKMPGKWQHIVIHAETVSSELPQAGAFQALALPNHGLWLIAQELNSQVKTGESAAILLKTLQEQVLAGEDLTAALLVAHARIHRERSDSSNAAPQVAVLAMRLSRQSNSFELAWVGKMQAQLIRGKEVISLAKPNFSDEQLGQETRQNPLQMTAVRLEGLGGLERSRPIIDRKLSHAQKGDFIVLSIPNEVLPPHFEDALQASLSGIWSLDYKAQKLLQACGAGLSALIIRAK